MWKYEDKDIKSKDDLNLDIEDYEGFVYIITNITNGKSYIGRKSFFTRRKKKLGKKELSLLEDKRSSKTRMVIKESNWVDYTGSNAELNSDIKNGDIVEKKILTFCKSKMEMTYYETKFQFAHEVIESCDWYNDSILGKFYSKIFLTTSLNG